MTCIPFLHNSSSFLLCFIDIRSCEWIEFTQNPLKQIIPDLFFPVHLCPYWNTRWLFVNLQPISDWLQYQQGLIMLLCWQQICALQLLLFWYKLHQFLVEKLESFPQFFSNEVSDSVAFFLWIPPRISKLWGLWFWKYVDFFVLHGDFLHITSFIGMLLVLFFQKFKVHEFMDLCANFLN